MFLLIVKDTTNETETFLKHVTRNAYIANYFCVIPKNQGLHKSTAHIFSNNSRSTNHISLTGTDNCYCELSKNTTLEENLQENQIMASVRTHRWRHKQMHRNWFH